MPNSLVAQLLSSDQKKSPIWIHEDAEIDYTQLGNTNGFNFHPAIELDTAYFERELKTGNFSLFLVDLTAAENSLQLGILDGTPSIQLTDKSVENRQILDYKAKYGRSKILFYKDRWQGKRKSNPDLFLENLSSKSIAEIILFDRAISKKEQSIIESYLAIKYGISLADNYQFLCSSGKSVFKTDSDEKYDYRIAALGRDDKLSLYQKQSVNHDTDMFFCISLSNMEEYNFQNEGILMDQSFIFWADNNEGLTMSKDNPGHFLRTWKIFTEALQESEKELFLFFEIPEPILQNYPDGWCVSLSPYENDFSNEKLIPIQLNNDGIHHAKIVIDKSIGPHQFLKILNKKLAQKEYAQVEIFPNPIKRNESCRIYLKNLPNTTVHYFLRDQTGKLIISDSVENKTNYTEINVHVTGIGMHTLEIEYEDTRLSKSIIVVD